MKCVHLFKVSILSIILHVLIVLNVCAQNFDFNFNNLSTKEGLSNNFVTNIIEDSHGFMWIATADGLNRYNGYKCDVFKYDKENTNSIPNNFILSLAEDKSNNIWIGTNQSGLVRYNISEERFYRYFNIPGNESSLPGFVIRDIYIDDNNQVWVATDFGLVKYLSKTNSFKRFYFPSNELEQTKHIDIRKIIRSSKHEIIVQSNFGLYKINLTTEQLDKFPLLKIEEKISNKDAPILFDNDSNLWVGDIKGLLKYNFKKDTYKWYLHQVNNPNSLSSNAVSIIFQDSKGKIWIGTQENGLNLYNANTDNFQVFKSSSTRANSLTNNIITSIYEDRNSNLWVSTQEGGVNYLIFNRSYFEHFNHNPFDHNSISSSKVSAFFQDKTGNIWVGTGDGSLNKMNEKNYFQKYNFQKDNFSRSILGIISNKPNSILITGWGIGLYEFNTVSNTFNDLYSQAKINGNPLSKNIKGIGTDAKGNIWLATHDENGIIVYSPSTQKYYNASYPGTFNRELLSVPYAVNMIEDSKKRIWIVSYTGLYMFDSTYHAFYHIPDSLSTISSNYNFTIFEDGHKQLWLGNSNGLDRINESKNAIRFERMSYKYPIPGNIKAILQDNHGYLWLSSNLELTQFHPESKKIKHYKINRELPSQEFFEHSCLKSINGEMYFGGTSGFFRFQPDSITKYNPDSKVYIVDFMLFNKSQKPNSTNSVLKKSILETDHIILSHDQTVLGFEYAVLNYNQYKTTEYAYKMDGFDKDWYFVGEKRSVTYTNLPPGKYVFKVTTVDGYEPLLHNIREIKITILPPFWRTYWAYSAYIIIILLLLYLFRWNILNREKLKNELKLEKLNMQNVQENNLMKLRFFTNISHEFRTPLTLIKAPIEKLYQSNQELSKEELNYYYELIHNNTERLLAMVNQLMDYRKLEAGSLILEPSQGNIVEFCKNIYFTFIVLARQKNIDFTFQSQIESLFMSFDSDKMDKVLCNLLSNAFKFTPDSGKISVSIIHIKKELLAEKSDSDLLEITVKDNGIGICEKDLPHVFERFYSVSKSENGKIEGTGIGLTLAKELTELHNGQINVQSKEGEGAEFKIILPVTIHKTSEKDENQIIDKVKAEVVNSKIDKSIDSNDTLKQYKILLVEDDDELRNFIKNELENEYTIFVAKNGDEGLRLAFYQVPDLVLSDVMMPYTNGFELCKTLKTDERTSHLPVVLLTSHHSQEKHLEGLDAGADDYIFKPFSISILKARIHNLLSVRNEIKEKFKNGASLDFNDQRVEDKDRKLMQSVIDIILENISNENINADFIANKLLISRSLVYLKVEALSGQTVNEFIRNIRLKKSLRLLIQGNLNITEIAYEVGFSSQSYYTRSFNKLFGLSPKDYIKQNKIGM
jgi:signal transduction histidine kinase/ligand-binding sensor domain-containing protein/DNA-binding response OmpR family regulator